MVLSLETHSRSPVGHRLTRWHANRVTSVHCKSECHACEPLHPHFMDDNRGFGPGRCVTGCPGSPNKSGAARAAAVTVSLWLLWRSVQPVVSCKWMYIAVSAPALGGLWSVGERVVHMVFTRATCGCATGDSTSPARRATGGGGGGRC